MANDPLKFAQLPTSEEMPPNANEGIRHRSFAFAVPSTYTHLKARSHLYANKACGTGANANKCQKVACSAFATQVNEQAFRCYSLAAQMGLVS